MTIQQALDRADMIRPNMMQRELKVAALSELDGLVHQEILMKHWHRPEEREIPHYDESTDPGTVLLVPFPYDEIYTYWLQMKIDDQTLEYDKYNNDRLKFNAAYESFSDYWTRTRMPISTVRELRI